MLQMKKIPLLLMGGMIYPVILFMVIGMAFPACGQDPMRSIPSLGTGTHEIFMYADYFCPPCKRIDAKAEALFKELLATGKVKITFVDVPFNRLTPLYVKYYLYAANAKKDPDNILHVRRTLYDAAQEKHIQTEPELVNYLKSQKIAVKPMDEKSVFPVLSAAIKGARIERTPTCIIRYIPAGERRCVGDIEIWNGLMELKSMLSAGK